jgi:hypothetical protein
MPEITVTIPAELHAKLTRWAEEASRPFSELVVEILSAGQHARDFYDPTMSQSTRWIRWCRDGGCGFCEHFEPTLAAGKTEAPDYETLFATKQTL